MASVTEAQRPPIGLTILLLVAVIVVGFLATQWIVGIVLALFRLALILVGLYLVLRVGWYLVRKGR
ncbi:MAG: hypothetical protein AAF531_01675 [Actinomycetota bacterium]